MQHYIVACGVRSGIGLVGIGLDPIQRIIMVEFKHLIAITETKRAEIKDGPEEMKATM
jgi:hypothetical protein